MFGYCLFHVDELRWFIIKEMEKCFLVLVLINGALSPGKFVSSCSGKA